MTVEYATNTLAKICSDVKVLQRKLGKENAKKFAQRVRQLTAAENLAVYLREGLGHPEQLKGWDPAPAFSVRLNANYRLIFHPVDLDNTTDLSQCTEVKIESVVDYHGTSAPSWLIP